MGDIEKNNQNLEKKKNFVAVSAAAFLFSLALWGIIALVIVIAVTAAIT